ncbi:MAG: glycosyl hydrolase family 8 [Pseudochelatococcus sp.]
MRRLQNGFRNGFRGRASRMRALAVAFALVAAALFSVMEAGTFTAALFSSPKASAQAVSTAPGSPAPMPAGLIAPEEWRRYRDRFITAGRVVDDGNGNISHSEGQGYAMMLSVMAGDRATFAALWSFVRTELLIRDDGLAAWRWNPATRPHVTDINNASDGDILIAYALLLAADAWGDAGFARDAQQIVAALSKHAVMKSGGRMLLMPGVAGFGPRERTDGPVVNPSYWIFEALARFGTLKAGAQPWGGLTKSGLDLIDRSRFGPAGVPVEWVSLRDGERPRPAERFPNEYGYNALRIPLYLLRAGIDAPERLERFRRLWSGNGRPAPAIIRADTGEVTYRLSDPGYAMIVAALDCALDRAPVPDALRDFRPTLYYPSTLHLLGLALVRQRYPQCL